MSFTKLNPDGLPAPRGWNHGMLGPVGGRVLFVAGMTAAGADGTVPAGLDFLAQWDRALASIVAVLRAAGAQPEHVGRMTVFVADIEVYRTSLTGLSEVWNRHMGRHYPAMALVQAGGFVDPNAMVEIETTAVLPA